KERRHPENPGRFREPNDIVDHGLSVMTAQTCDLKGLMIYQDQYAVIRCEQGFKPSCGISGLGWRFHFALRLPVRIDRILLGRGGILTTDQRGSLIYLFRGTGLESPLGEIPVSIDLVPIVCPMLEHPVQQANRFKSRRKESSATRSLPAWLCGLC